MKLRNITIALLAMLGLTCLSIETVPNASDLHLKSPVKGDPGLKSVGPLAFGSAGLLLIAEPTAASILAVDTRDVGRIGKLAKPIEDVAAVLATGLLMLGVAAMRTEVGRRWYATAGGTARYTIDHVRPKR